MDAGEVTVDRDSIVSVDPQVHMPWTRTTRVVHDTAGGMLMLMQHQGTTGATEDVRARIERGMVIYRVESPEAAAVADIVFSYDGYVVLSTPQSQGERPRITIIDPESGTRTTIPGDVSSWWPRYWYPGYLFVQDPMLSTIELFMLRGIAKPDR